VHKAPALTAQEGTFFGYGSSTAETLGMNSRIHPKYKTKYRVTNWNRYDKALVQRGDITCGSRRTLLTNGLQSAAADGVLHAGTRTWPSKRP
jgi:hypothetical protein